MPEAYQTLPRRAGNRRRFTLLRMRDHVRRTLIVAAAVMLAACATPPTSTNPLLGVWRHDGTWTLDALMRDPAAPRALLDCYRQQRCGGSVIHYRTDEWALSPSPRDAASKTVSYRIVDNVRGHLLIRDYGQDPPTHRLVLIAPGRAYVERETDGYHWRDYLRRIR